MMSRTPFAIYFIVASMGTQKTVDSPPAQTRTVALVNQRSTTEYSRPREAGRVSVG